MELIAGPSLDHVIDDLKNGREPSGLAFGPSKGSSTSEHASADSSGSGSSMFSGTAYFDQVATMIADVADALDHAHEQAVIHRDVKPSNLLLAPDGRLSINDFGLARMLEQPGMTMSGEFVGTPMYMSPEQIASGRTKLDHRTDIYSLGATLYELLTLVPPFSGNSRDEVLTQILHKDPRQPRKLKGRVPQDLETICMKAIERDPDRRYQTAGLFAQDLRSFADRRSISARRVGPIEKTVRLARRNPVVTALLAVIIVGPRGFCPSPASPVAFARRAENRSGTSRRGARAALPTQSNRRAASSGLVSGRNEDSRRPASGNAKTRSLGRKSSAI